MCIIIYIGNTKSLLFINLNYNLQHWQIKIVIGTKVEKKIYNFEFFLYCFRALAPMMHHLASI